MALARIVLLSALLGACALVSVYWTPSDDMEGSSRRAEQRALANQSALGVILGEFRTSMSDMMFLKTERLLHGGVAYTSHGAAPARQRDLELLRELPETEGGCSPGCSDPGHQHADHSGHEHGDVCEHAGCASAADEQEEDAHVHGPGCGHDHGGGCSHEGAVDTVIPTAENDYRGWVGHLHRQVTPWRPPEEQHHLVEGSELIPWFRMITLSDPHYVRGYTLGAAWLEELDPGAALAFLEEGLAKNPEAFQLHLSKAFLLLQSAGSAAGHSPEALDPAQQSKLAESRTSFERAATCMASVRPAGWAPEQETPGGPWTANLETDARAAVRMAVLLNDRCGDPERAKQLARRYLEMIPEHGSLRRYLQETH